MTQIKAKPAPLQEHCLHLLSLSPTHYREEPTLSLGSITLWHKTRQSFTRDCNCSCSPNPYLPLVSTSWCAFCAPWHMMELQSHGCTYEDLGTWPDQAWKFIIAGHSFAMGSVYAPALFSLSLVSSRDWIFPKKVFFRSLDFQGQNTFPSHLHV